MLTLTVVELFGIKQKLPVRAETSLELRAISKNRTEEIHPSLVTGMNTHESPSGQTWQEEVAVTTVTSVTASLPSQVVNASS